MMNTPLLGLKTQCCIRTRSVTCRPPNCAKGPFDHDPPLGTPGSRIKPKFSLSSLFIQCFCKMIISLKSFPSSSREKCKSGFYFLLFTSEKWLSSSPSSFSRETVIFSSPTVASEKNLVFRCRNPKGFDSIFFCAEK